MKQIEEMFKTLYQCIDNSTTVNMINIEVVNKVLLLHKLLLLHGMLEKLPAAYRNIFLQRTIPQIPQEREYTELAPVCIDILKDIIKIAILASTKISVPRIAIYLSRTSAILARRLSDNGIYINRENLKGLLRELEIYLTLTLEVLTT